MMISLARFVTLFTSMITIVSTTRVRFTTHLVDCVRKSMLLRYYFVLIRENRPAANETSQAATTWRADDVVFMIICYCYFPNTSGEFVNFPHCVLKKKICFWPSSYHRLMYPIFGSCLTPFHSPSPFTLPSIWTNCHFFVHFHPRVPSESARNLTMQKKWNTAVILSPCQLGLDHQGF